MYYYDQSTRLKTKGRVPTVPLTYEQRHLAVPGELILNPDNGNVYVAGINKNDDGTYKIIDITEIIKKAISAEGGSTVTVTIPGLGKMTLNEALLKILSENIVLMHSADSVNLFLQQYSCDYASTVIKNKKLQIKGFDEAKDGTCPIKRDGQIKWAELSAGSGSSSSKVLEYAIKDDEGNVYLKNNSVSYLSIDDAHPIKIVLPSTIASAYSTVKFNLTIGEIMGDVSFNNNILFEWITDKDMSTNTINIFEFETYDYGKTWLGNRTKYDIDTEMVAQTIEITKSYLDQNALHKDQLEEAMSWTIIDE